MDLFLGLKIREDVPKKKEYLTVRLTVRVVILLRGPFDLALCLYDMKQILTKSIFFA